MTPAPVAVTVVIPFDWVTGILVPAASILVSAGIALLLARRERRAADRDRVGAAGSRLIRALTQLAFASGGGGPTFEAARISFEGSLNEFSAALETEDADVPKYVSIVLDEALATRDAEAVNRTGMFLIGAIEGWVRGQLPTREFSTHMPPDDGTNWITVVRLDEWRRVAGPATSASPGATRDGGGPGAE